MVEETLETFEEPVICRRETENRNIILVLPTNVAAPHLIECFAPQITGNEDSYTFVAGDYQTLINISEPIENAEECEECQKVLEKARVKYNDAGYEPEFKFYQKRSPALRQAYQQEHQKCFGC